MNDPKQPATSGPRGARRITIPMRRAGEVEAPPPQYKSAGAAGLDLCAAITSPLVVPPGRRALVPTGWAMAIPAGYEGQVRPRSGLALKHGVTVLNSPGTIDSDYTGHIQVILVNLGDAPFTIGPGDRIAQLVIAPVAQAELELVAELPATERGAGGYGSTGV